MDLSGYDAYIGQTGTITVEARGDLSSSSEKIKVTDTTTGNYKRGGDTADDNVYRTIIGSLTVEVVDIGGGTPGLALTFNPTGYVNYSPSGMGGLYWSARISGSFD